MTKMNILIYSIVFSIIIIILLYFGLIRYVTLKYRNCNYYINRYKDIKQYNNVIISIPCIPNNIEKTIPTLKSILDQTTRVNMIYINIPSIDKEVPEDIKKVANVNITGKDYNSLQNILPTLLKEGNEDSVIICLNNNTIYSVDTIEEFISTSEKNPDKLICIDTNDFNKGILIKPKFFSSNIMNTDYTDINYTDYIKQDLKNKNIEIIKIDTKLDNYSC